MKKILLLLFFLTAIIQSCSIYSRVSNQNLYFSYRKEFNTIKPKYIVHHINDTSSKVYFQLPWKDLLYIKASGEALFSASAKMSWKMFISYDSRLLLDSGSLILRSKSPLSTNDSISEGTFLLKARRGQNNLLEITVNDIQRNLSVKHFIGIEKFTHHGRQDFMVRSNDKIKFENFLTENRKLSITHSDSATKKLFVRFYKRDFPLPLPPFSEAPTKPFIYKADSLFEIDSDENKSFILDVNQLGFFHIQSDTSRKDGITIFRFQNDYPSLVSAEDLLGPLRYLTSRKEYDEMIVQKNKKAMIDQFWLDNGGNSERARELIRTFYNRVQDANNYFTSYLEGWKTDRGLILIIYGAPTAVYRSVNSETWVYGEENNIRSLHFTFVKVINPFTDNDFSLSRNENYKDSWFVAVDTWRQGRVFAD